MATGWTESTTLGSRQTAAARRGSRSILDSFVVAPLLVAYVIAIFFPNITRFAGSELNVGVSTLIVIALIFIGPHRAFRAIAEERTLLLLLAFFAYLLIPTAFNASVSSAFRLGIMLIYVALAAVIARSELSPAQISRFWSTIALCAGLSSLLTVVDFLGIVDVPFCNEVTYDTKIEGERTAQASGFFEHRSAMAAVFSIAITGCAIVGLTDPSRLRQLVFLGSVLASLLALFLTHNRSGVFGSIFVIGLFTLISGRLRVAQRIRLLVTGGLIGITLLAIASILFPEHVEAYLAKLGFLGLAEETWESDTVRIDLFVHAILGIADAPHGNGLTHIPLYPGILMSPHNIITQVIWAGGVVALFWLPVFGLSVLLRLGIVSLSRVQRTTLPGFDHRLAVLHDASLYGLLAWVLNGMTHQTLSTGLAWIVFGMLLMMTRARIHGPNLGAQDAGISTRDATDDSPSRGGSSMGQIVSSVP